MPMPVLVFSRLFSKVMIWDWSVMERLAERPAVADVRIVPLAAVIL